MKNDKIEYTSISEFIKELEKIKEKCGDIPVCCKGSSPIRCEVEPYYYDGGYFARDAKDPKNYLHSITRKEGLGISAEGFPKSCVQIYDESIWEAHKLNGRPVREIDPESWQFLDEEEKKEMDIFNGQLVKYNYDHDQKKYKAYLDSGEFALGEHMFGAKVNLVKLYQEKKNEKL